MRSRGLFLPLLLLALIASGCSGSDSGRPGADRAVDDDSADWDVDEAILRTVLIENAMESGLSRSSAGCMIDAVQAAADISLTDLEGIDLTAQTGSGADRELATVLADSLVECGPSLKSSIEADIPGALAIPGTHSVEAECVTNAYVEAWRDLYFDRFRDRSIANEKPEPASVEDRVVGIVAGCSAGGAVILGASNLGHLDTHALSTLEWECLEARVAPGDFDAAFPFPEEPGDALARMGSSVGPEVAFCEAWVSGEDVPDGASDAG